MSLLVDVELYAKRLLMKAIPARLCFHCLSHTKNVVKAVQIIGSQEKVSTAQMEVLIISAWFHDTGFISTYDGHEEMSKIIAEEFLKERNYPLSKINEVLTCIGATKLPQQPGTPLQAIMCDADLFHFSQKDYWVKNALLKKEMEACLKDKYDEEMWLIQNLNFMRNHHYFSNYARDVLEPKKQFHIQENIEFLRECLDEKN